MTPVLLVPFTRQTQWRDITSQLLRTIFPSIKIIEFSPFVFRDQTRTVVHLNNYLSSCGAVVIFVAQEFVSHTHLPIIAALLRASSRGLATHVLIVEEDGSFTLPPFLSSFSVWTPINFGRAIADPNLRTLQHFLRQIAGPALLPPLPVRPLDDRYVYVAEYSLIVTQAITLTWKLDAALERLDLKEQIVPRPWNNAVLSDLAKGLLDLAIYNRSETLRFINKTEAGRGVSRIKILASFGASMSGDNFYVLSSNDRLKTVSPKNLLREIKGSKICVPKNSDIFENMLSFLKADDTILNKYNIEIVDIEPSITEQQLLSLNPTLVLAGQNLRLESHFSGEFTEIFNTENLNEQTRNEFVERSKNVLVVGSRLIQRLDAENLNDLARMVLNNFRTTIENPDEFEETVKRIASTLNMSYAEDVVRAILTHSYRRQA